MGEIIIGKMNSVRKNAMPRTGCSSASAMPSTISTVTHTAAKISVVASDDHTRGLLKAEMKLSKPTKRALVHGVPMLQSNKLSWKADSTGYRQAAAITAKAGPVNRAGTQCGVRMVRCRQQLRSCNPPRA